MSLLINRTRDSLKIASKEKSTIYEALNKPSGSEMFSALKQCKDNSSAPDDYDYVVFNAAVNLNRLDVIKYMRKKELISVREVGSPFTLTKIYESGRSDIFQFILNDIIQIDYKSSHPVKSKWKWS